MVFLGFRHQPLSEFQAFSMRARRKVGCSLGAEDNTNSSPLKPVNDPWGSHSHPCGTVPLHSTEDVPSV